MKLILPIGLLMFVTYMKGQLSISSNSSACTSATVNFSASGGTLASSGYTWSSAPAGAAFTSTTGASTNVIFNSPGIYTITAAADLTTGPASETKTILVNPSPVINISADFDTLCAGQSANLTASGAQSYTWTAHSSFMSSLFSPSVTVTPSATTVYTVSGTNGFGCVSRKSFTVVHTFFPQFNITASPTSLCPGYKATLTASGLNSVEWTSNTFTGSIVANWIYGTAGSYTAQLNNGDNCKASESITINALPPLAVQVAQSASATCIKVNGEITPVNLSASGAATYVWAPYLQGHMTYSLGPETIVTPTTTTCFTVTGSTSACSGTAVACVISEYCAGITEREFQLVSVVFPNPVLSELTLVPSIQQDLSIIFTNLEGQIIYDQTVHADKMIRLDLSDFAAGIYFLNIKKESASQYFKIIKN